jgi:hypothetical protein
VVSSVAPVTFVPGLSRAVAAEPAAARGSHSVCKAHGRCVICLAVAVQPVPTATRRHSSARANVCTPGQPAGFDPSLTACLVQRGAQCGAERRQAVMQSQHMGLTLARLCTQLQPAHGIARLVCSPEQSFGTYEAPVETGDVILAEHGLAMPTMCLGVSRLRLQLSCPPFFRPPLPTILPELVPIRRRDRASAPLQTVTLIPQKTRRARHLHRETDCVRRGTADPCARLPHWYVCVCVCVRL